MEGKQVSKMVAAIAAVMQFLQQEEVQVVAESVAVPPPPPIPFTPWGLAGRQDAMMYRSLWQRRVGRS